MLVLVFSMYCCLIACNSNDIATPTPEPTLGSTTQGETTLTADPIPDSTTPNGEVTPVAVFDTNNIEKITFFAYYGEGIGSVVPDESMEEITLWLTSFTVGEKAPELLEPGTNTCFVQIQYSDGTSIKKGLDTVEIDGVLYRTNCDNTPSCYYDIIEKTSLG